MSIDSDISATVRQVHRDPLELLRGLLTGRVYRPDEPEWDRVRTPWVVNVDQTPLAVVEVADAEDVGTAVGWAVENHRQVTAQPVGHGAYGGLDGVLLLRTRALNAIQIDPEAGTATVGAGVTVGELLDTLEGTGWSFLAGSNPDPTVLGMAIGGGLSWFGRACGLAANRIISAELVDAAGRRRWVTSADTDLFWAIRGGGGDFGILTALQIQLIPAPALYGGQLLWPVEEMPAVLRAFRELTTTAPDELTAWYATVQFPPLQFVPEALRGRSYASIAATYLGGADEAESLLAPVRAVPGIALDSMRPVAMRDLGQVTGEPTTPMPVIEHSVFLDDLDDDVITGLTRVAGAGTSGGGAVSFPAG